MDTTTYRVFRITEAHHHGTRTDTVLLAHTTGVSWGWYALTEEPVKELRQPVRIRRIGDVHEGHGASTDEDHEGAVEQLLTEDGATEVDLSALSGSSPEEFIARVRRLVPRMPSEEEAEAAVERLSGADAYHQD
ncbi:hypothetical protein [Nocardiopsis synnemataformans]|uniref:hypothetical protein n=1 Tax=Nocardiopsis synnemataformans TaxID=61305 RepID=UPI003EBB191B